MGTMRVKYDDRGVHTHLCVCVCVSIIVGGGDGGEGCTGGRDERSDIAHRNARGATRDASRDM